MKFNAKIGYLKIKHPLYYPKWYCSFESFQSFNITLQLLSPPWYRVMGKKYSFWITCILYSHTHIKKGGGRYFNEVLRTPQSGEIYWLDMKCYNSNYSKFYAFLFKADFIKMSLRFMPWVNKKFSFRSTLFCFLWLLKIK